jgi:hypothetical protein
MSSGKLPCRCPKGSARARVLVARSRHNGLFFDGRLRENTLTLLTVDYTDITNEENHMAVTCICSRVTVMAALRVAIIQLIFFARSESFVVMILA